MKWRYLIPILVVAFAIANQNDRDMGILPDHNQRCTMTPQKGEKPLETLKTIHSDYQIAVWLYKSEESLRLKAYRDNNRWSIGWGTKSFEGEVITYEEANQRAQEAFNKRYDWIRRKFPKLDRWTALVYTNTYYNAGSPGPALYKALKNNQVDRIAKLILAYNKSNGKPNPVLTARRKLESRLLLSSPEERQYIAETLRQDVIQSIQKNK